MSMLAPPYHHRNTLHQNLGNYKNILNVTPQNKTLTFTNYLVINNIKFI
jgi:hypothetical protein